MTSQNLQAQEYSPFYQTYIDKVNANDLKKDIRDNLEKVLAFLKNIPKDKYEYRYDTNKWTIKEVVQHIMDTERIFAYRALRIARNDLTPLPGFDQNDYVAPSKANERTYESLLNEYRSVRLSTITLFDSFDDEMLMRIGNASNNQISVRALGFIIIGHENHHCQIIRERYL